MLAQMHGWHIALQSYMCVSLWKQKTQYPNEDQFQVACLNKTPRATHNIEEFILRKSSKWTLHVVCLYLKDNGDFLPP